MDVVMPQLGETVKEGTVTVWHRKVGERVEANEPLFEVNTDKVETEVPAPVSGVLAAILVAEGSTVQVGATLAVIEEEGKARAVPAAAREAPLSPVVRRLLAEHGLDASTITGTGSGGRITRDDVLAHVERSKSGGKPQGEERLPLSKIRKRTAEQMALSWRTIPHVLQAVEVDFQAVDVARLPRAEDWKAKEGWALTYLPFVAFAVSRALPEFPALNASLDGDALVPHRRINLGIAVDLGGEGLIVPVIKDAGEKSLPDLA
ncbi:MAG TPA: dihydrolipoamide acetyltransferase family protein, partial [Myxococcales bacterium]